MWQFSPEMNLTNCDLKQKCIINFITILLYYLKIFWSLSKEQLKQVKLLRLTTKIDVAQVLILPWFGIPGNSMLYSILYQIPPYDKILTFN